MAFTNEFLAILNASVPNVWHVYKEKKKRENIVFSSRDRSVALFRAKSLPDSYGLAHEACFPLSAEWRPYAPYVSENLRKEWLRVFGQPLISSDTKDPY